MKSSGLIATFGAAMLSLMCATAHGQAPYPNKPVRVIVGGNPGNAQDIVARIIFAKVGSLLGQRFVIEDRGGASGTSGVLYVVDSAPDGYTLLDASSNPLATAVALFKSLPYDPINDLEPVARLSKSSAILAVNSKLPIRSIPDFIAYARAHPDMLRFGSTGVTTAGAIAMDALMQTTGITLEQVPYNEASQAIADLANGNIDAMLYLTSSFMPFVETQQLRLIANADYERTADVPNLPTIAEEGVKGFGAVAWTAVFAPRSTPKDIVDKLSAALQDALKDPIVISQILKSAGSSPFYATASELNTFQIQEIERYRQLINALGLEVQ